MKKSKLLLVSTSALLAFGLGASLFGHQKAQKVEAASFVNETIHDEFANGIDAEKYDVIDSEEKVGLVEKNGVLKFGNFDFNAGYVRHANAITRGEGQSVVFQFKKIEVPAGQYLIIEFTNGYSWGGQMIMTQLDGAIVITGDNRTGKNSDGASTMWIGVNAYSSFRWIWNDDGSLLVQGSNDETTFTTVCTYDANSFTVPTTGYVGLLGNGLTGNVTMDNCKVGLADDAALTNLQWVVEDDFETANSGKFILDSSVYYNGNQVFEQLGGVKAVMLSDPASGSGIVTKASYTLANDSSILFSAQLKLELVELGEKAIGLGFGLGSEVTVADSAFLVGVRKVESVDQLVLLKNGEVLTSAALSGLGAEIEFNVAVTVEDQGFKAVGSVGGVKVEQQIANAEGRLAIAVSGAGVTSAKVLELNASSYTGIIETGRNISIVNSFNHNWLVENGSGSVTMDDNGLINFTSSADNTRIQTRFKYVNFDLQFDAKLQQFEEDDDGNVTQASTWLGVSFGRNTYEDDYWAENTEMLYMTADTVNSITTQNGHTPAGVPTARGWFTAEYLPLDAANKDVMFHYHIVAEDGAVSFSVSRDGGEEVTVIIYEGMKTNGYISFVGTAGANYFLKNVQLVNTDGVVEANHAPVAQDGELELIKGQTGNGQLVATDADEYDAEYLSFEVVENEATTLGELTLNEDGSYSFAAVAVGTATFTFKVSDTEDYSEVKTVTITVADDQPEDPGTSEEPGSSQEPGSSETPDAPAKKGCGGSIAAASIIISCVALAGVGLLSLRRKEK